MFKPWYQFEGVQLATHYPQLRIPIHQDSTMFLPIKVLYSPQRCNGFGLSDGEVMERMWSYLRRFGRMTKEMRPSHRVDVLAHALLYYGQMTKQKLRKCLLKVVTLPYHAVCLQFQQLYWCKGGIRQRSSEC